jgi:hypothetical protein
MKNIIKISIITVLAVFSSACEDFPVDSDGLLITSRAECYVSNFDLLGTDLQTIKIGNSYIDTTAQVAILYVKYGTSLKSVWPQISLCEDSKLTPKITEWMDFSDSKLEIEFIDGDWKSGNPQTQLGQRIVENSNIFPSSAKKFTVIAGNRKIKKEYTFLIVERPLQ